MDGAVVAEIALPEGDPGAVRDAAAELRGVGGGFGHVHEAVGDAVAATPTWLGIASMNFRNTCIDYQGAATHAHHACTAAAGALDEFADELESARTKVKHMQEEGKHLLAAEADGNRKAEAAQGRMRAAAVNLRMAMLDAPADAGATLQAYRTEEEDARREMSREAGRAADARTALEKLKREARAIRDHVDQRGNAAAAKVRGAADGLPTVVGAPGGGAGGTPVTAHTSRFEAGVTIVVFHLGGNTAVIKEHTVDGKWRVTEIDGVEGGLEFDPVPGAGVDGGGKAGRLGAGADVEAAFLAQYKHGETYEFPTESQADDFIDYKRSYVPPDAQDTMVSGYPTPEYLSGFALARGKYLWSQRQRPVETFSEGGARAKVSASMGDVAGGSAEAEDTLGTRTDTRTGAKTTYSRTSATVAAQVGLPFDAGGQAKGEALTALTRDAAGRPTSYSVTLSAGAESSGGAHLHGVAHHETTGVRVERQMTLDLNDPDNAAAVRAYQHGDSSQLIQRLHDDARVDVRQFDTGSTSSGANIDVKIVKIDGSLTTEDSRLTSASHHAGGGPTVVTDP